ncbi:MAG: dihydroorotate dehydrogenase [Gemmatimonadaceae bacterium]|nr:dihydroorotate dehydrogenase [Gemmatimonadaceae bacterium]
MTDALLAVDVAGIRFQNPVLLASGTAAYGREVAGVIDLEALGGLVTKAVSVRPRNGAPPLRVVDTAGGMLNAIGLANPGVADVRAHDLPWLAKHLSRARVLVNVVGDTVEDYGTVVGELADAAGVSGFELNVSCPNVKAGGLEFGADPRALREVVATARAGTKLPLFVKLSPALADVAGAAKIAVDAGADAITLVNTLPALVIDVERRRPALGFGTGGLSGAALLPVGVRATWMVRRAVSVPIMGVGGIARGTDAVQYLLAGASLVAIGTAALRDPRAPERVVRELEGWCRAHDVRAVRDLTGALEWPA